MHPGAWIGRDAQVCTETELAPAFGGVPRCSHTGYPDTCANVPPIRKDVRDFIRQLDAFRLAVALDRNAGRIRVKALISSAFMKTRDLQNLVANGA